MLSYVRYEEENTKVFNYKLRNQFVLFLRCFRSNIMGEIQ